MPMDSFTFLTFTFDNELPEFKGTLRFIAAYKKPYRSSDKSTRSHPI